MTARCIHYSHAPSASHLMNFSHQRRGNSSTFPLSVSSVSHLTAAHSTWTGVVLISTFPTELGCPEMTQEPMLTDRKRPASDFCNISFRAWE